MKIDKTPNSTKIEGSSSVDLSVVVPVFNEELNIPPLFEELRNELKKIRLSYEIIFIDDGSSDGSANVLRELHELNDQVKVVRFRRNFGQTAAFAAGFDCARGSLVLTLDSDGQNDPADISLLLDKMNQGDYDLVVGWRVNRKEPILRRGISHVANMIISRVSGIKIHDRGCSLKVFKSDLIKDVRLYGQLHRFLPELASSVGARVAEVPVNDRNRMYGEPKYGALSRTPRVILDLMTVTFLLSFFTSPMRLFGSAGILIGSIGLLVGGGLVLTKISHGISDGWIGFNAYEIGSRPLFLFSLFSILLCVQFLFIGLLGEMILRTYHEAQGKPIYSIREVLD